MPLSANVAQGQASPQSLLGTVRENRNRGQGLAGVEVQIDGEAKGTSNDAGQFRIGNLKSGSHLLFLRRIGYLPIRTSFVIRANEVTVLDFYMDQSPYLLPTIETTVTTHGIYGTVWDSSLVPLKGAIVDVLGFGGEDATTDQVGHFEFPKAHGGTYMIRVSMPGYGERRTVLEVPKGEGRRIEFRLVKSGRGDHAPGESEALWALRRRLALSFRNTRMSPSEIARFGSMRLCDVPKISVLAGEPTTVIVNGVQVLREVSLCSWRMDEVALIEFCSRVGCHNPDYPMPLRYPDASGRPRRGGPVIIWEKR